MHFLEREALQYVSLPPLNFHSLTILRTMSNLVGGELRKCLIAQLENFFWFK